MYEKMKPYFVYFQNKILINTLCAILFAVTVKVIIKRYFTKTSKVNCWFCNHDLLVSKKNKNSFMCIHCDQYNGFKDDGDYNKVIPAQKYNDLNPNFGTKNSTLQSYSLTFCNVCIDNEARKMELFHMFTPIDETNYFKEYDEYKKEIERRFPLCYVCEIRVRDHLNEMNNKILPDYIRWSTLSKRNSRINKRRPSIFSHLNLTPILTILAALLGILLLQIKSNFVSTNVYLEIALRQRPVIDFLLFSTVLAVSKLSNIRPSMKFGNAKLLFLLMIVTSTTVLSKWSHGLPNFLRLLFNIPIQIWILFIMLEFCLKIVRLVRSCSFTKSSKPVLVNYNSSDNFVPRSITKEYASPTSNISNATNNNCMSKENPFKKTTLAPSVIGDRTTQYKNSDAGSVCSFQSHNSANTFLNMRTTPSFFSGQSMASSKYHDKSVTSLFNGPLTSPSYKDDLSVRSFKTQVSLNPFANSAKVASLFADRDTSQYYGDTNSVSSHFSVRTNIVPPIGARSCSPMQCDRTLSNNSQDTLAIGSPSLYSRAVSTGHMSRAPSVYSRKSHLSSSSSRASPKERQTILKVAWKYILGVVIGCSLNLIVMLFVAYLEPNLEKYF